MKFFHISPTILFTPGLPSEIEGEARIYPINLTLAGHLVNRPLTQYGVYRG
jgi:hypothetical protein